MIDGSVRIFLLSHVSKLDGRVLCVQQKDRQNQSIKFALEIIYNQQGASQTLSMTHTGECHSHHTSNQCINGKHCVCSLKIICKGLPQRARTCLAHTTSKREDAGFVSKSHSNSWRPTFKVKVGKQQTHVVAMEHSNLTNWQLRWLTLYCLLRI